MTVASTFALESAARTDPESVIGLSVNVITTSVKSVVPSVIA